MRDDHWLDRDAGPVVRPYALTRGRTRPQGESIDLLATVLSTRAGVYSDLQLEPEYQAVVRQCRRPKSIADLASDLDLPLGVVRILVSDMRENGLITIHQPARTRVADPQLLKDVADALRRL